MVYRKESRWRTDALQRQCSRLHIQIQRPWYAPGFKCPRYASYKPGARPQPKPFRENEGYLYPYSGVFSFLPAEIVHEIISHLPPRAQVCFSRTCRFFYNLIAPTVHLWSLSFPEQVECFFDLARDSQSTYCLSTTLHCTDCGQTCRTSSLKASRKAASLPGNGYDTSVLVVLRMRNLKPASSTEPTRGAASPGSAESSLDWPRNLRLEPSSDSRPSSPTETVTIEPIDLTMCIRYPYPIDDNMNGTAEDTTFMACLNCSKFYCHYDGFPPAGWNYYNSCPYWFLYTGYRGCRPYNVTWTMRQESHGDSTLFEAGKVRMHKTKDKIPCEYGVGAVVSGGKELALGFPPGKWTLKSIVRRWFENKIAFKTYSESELVPLRREAALKGDRASPVWCEGQEISHRGLLTGAAPDRGYYRTPLWN